MKKLLLQGGSLHRNAGLGLACVLGALTASCATGSPIENEDVVFIPSARPSSADRGGGDGDGVEPSASEAGEGLQPASGETTQEGDADDLPRSDQPGEGDPSSQPDDEEPADGDSEPLPPVDVPIVDTDDPDIDDTDDPTPGPGSNPIIEPDPVPEPPEDDDSPPAPDPVVPPVTNPDLNPVPPLEPDSALPAAGHCLAGWEGSSCDVCSGQTQSDRLACRLYIDCYIASDCDPASCGSVEQVCGVNRLGNGLAPKEIADSVYGCMCAL